MGQPLARRRFLQVAGASAATVSLALAGCSGSDPIPLPTASNTLNLTTGDTGVLNYFYLLKQLQAAFYQKVVSTPPTDFQPGEKAAFDDLRDHEVIHRETLRYMLDTAAYDANIASPLAFDFSTVTLTTRVGVLNAAQQFEELGTAAFAGGLQLLTTATTVALLLKMASVEARHAAYVRDLRSGQPLTDADVVVTANGLRSVAVAKTPVQVVADTKAFFLPIVISAASLPVA